MYRETGVEMAMQVLMDLLDQLDHLVIRYDMMQKYDCTL